MTPMNYIENRSGDEIKVGDSARRKFDHNQRIIFDCLRTKQLP